MSFLRSLILNEDECRIIWSLRGVLVGKNTFYTNYAKKFIGNLELSNIYTTFALGFGSVAQLDRATAF